MASTPLKTRWGRREVQRGKRERGVVREREREREREGSSERKKERDVRQKA